MPCETVLGRRLGGVAAIVLTVVLALVAGAGLAVQPRLLAPLPFLALLVFPPARSAQAVLALALIEGATSPFGEILGLNPVYLAVWLLVPLLYLSEEESLEGVDRTVIAAVAAYVLCLFLASFLHPGPVGLTHTLSLFNYVGAFLLAAMLARESLELIAVPLLAALAAHEVIAGAELLTNSSWLYAEWKALEATKVAGITRVASTVADPNYFAVTLILLASAVVTVAKGTRYQRPAIALAGGAAVLLPFTFSRAAAIAVLVALIAWAFRAGMATASKMAFRAAVFLACATLAIVVIAPGAPAALLSRYSPSQRSDASIQSRSALQKLGVEQALAHPLAGIGNGTFESRAQALYTPTKPHNLQTDVLNTYLQAWLVGGVLTLVAFGVALLLPTWRLIRRSAPLGFGLLGVAVALFTLNGLTLMPLWCALGIAAVLTARPERARAAMAVVS